MAFTDNTTGGRVIREGLMPVRIVLTGICHVGDLIGFDAVSSNVWEPASASGKVPPELIAGEQCKTSGDEIVCFKMAYVDYGSSCDVEAGDTVYASNTAGQYAATPGSTWNFAVGQAVSTTEVFVCPRSFPISVYSGTGTGAAGYFRAELESGRTSATRFSGIEIDVKTIDGSTLGNDIYGIRLFMQCKDTDAAGTSKGAFMRLEDGSDASCHPQTWILFQSGPRGPTNFFDFGTYATPTGGAWTNTGTSKTGDNGFITVLIGGVTSYINLHSS